MLEKAAKISGIIQGIAALVFLYSFFVLPQQASTDTATVRPMTHPSWLPIVSVGFLALAVLTSSVLSWVALRKHKTDQNSADHPIGDRAKLKIQRATFGAGPHAEMPVTDQLQNAPREGLVIHLDGTLGNLLPRDPAFNVRKRLDVEYSYESDSIIHFSRLAARSRSGLFTPPRAG